jgi:hypothetical protein
MQTGILSKKNIKWILIGISVLLIVSMFLPYYRVKADVFEMIRNEYPDVTYERGNEIATHEKAFGLAKLDEGSDYYFYAMYLLLLIPLTVLFVFYRNRHPRTNYNGYYSQNENSNKHYFLFIAVFFIGIFVTSWVLKDYRYTTASDVLPGGEINYDFPLFIAENLFDTTYNADWEAALAAAEESGIQEQIDEVWRVDTGAEVQVYPSIGFYLSYLMFVLGIVVSGFAVLCNLSEKRTIHNS